MVSSRCLIIKIYTYNGIFCLTNNNKKTTEYYYNRKATKSFIIIKKEKKWKTKHYKDLVGFFGEKK